MYSSEDERPAGSVTHAVLNQAPPRVGVDEYRSNTALREAVHAFGADWAEDALRATGALVGQEDFQRDAELANTIPPRLHTHDRYGHRVDEVEFHPAYHRVMGSAIAAGAHTSAWADPGPGANVARVAHFQLFSQIEAGHACPVSMTHAVVPSLQTTPALAREWLPKVYSRTYDPQLRDPATKDGVIFGMAMTEKQGGSDVRANTTRAVPASGTHGEGTYALTGHKWFCSAPQSDAFLVLAQADAGLSCFLVPRVLPGGDRNPFEIQRLKDKLGNHSNASSEIELAGTLGRLVGEEGRGVRTIVEMVNRTRLDCIIGTTAGMRQSVAEAAWHARHRCAFGALLNDQPAMTGVLADLQLETEAATWTMMRLAAAADEDTPESAAFSRLAVPVAKYWICKRGPEHAYEAMECLGGNGYTEAFPLARRYREQPVLAIWEGSGNVIALDVLRAMATAPVAAEAFLAEVGLARGQDVVLDAHLDRTAVLMRSAEPRTARRVVEAMALALQASVLVRYAPAAVADIFIQVRLGADRSLIYGALPSGVALDPIVARA
ncbi:MAG: acyl-CoA dehydrogenase family protein [Dermatophilaceae bacterium]